MKLSFDHYKNLERVDLYLCNPDGRELFPVVGFDRVLTLRFNDLSELTFGCYSTTTSNDGTVIDLEVYDYIQTRRLIFATDIGWFVITNVEENDNGVVKTKNVTCSSLQATFKDRGFACEERVYYLYNPSDPLDDKYNPDDEAGVPSVIGQLHQQLGIDVALEQGGADPATPYDNWTITYAPTSVLDGSFGGKGRNFKESINYAYEWMVNDVEDAFEVIFLFDFYNKAIKIVTPTEVTAEKANVVYSFSNFIKDITITENAEDIVTVMNCKGENCDISGVNPTGMPYICDFSYYMGSNGEYKWMSQDLTDALIEWKDAVDAEKEDYQSLIVDLRETLAEITEKEIKLQEISKIYTDLSTAVAKRSMVMDDNDSVLGGIVWCETVNIGEKSIDSESNEYRSALSLDSDVKCYTSRPTYNARTHRWTFSGSNTSGAVSSVYGSTESGTLKQYLYFDDNNSSSVHQDGCLTYCVLQGAASVDDNGNAVYTCKGYKRYTSLINANVWMKKYDKIKNTLNSEIDELKAQAKEYEDALKEISDSVNIVSYLAGQSGGSELLKELNAYWIEGDYTNDNIVVDEETTQEDEIDLENELYESGEIELSRVCQPKLQFSLTSVDCLKQFEFASQMAELELGKIITVEKEEGVWYYPALLEMEFNLDSSDSFNLQFANALSLDDWGYTYGDLMMDASSTSRQVSANWQNILAYSKERKILTPLIQEPLSSTLRAAFANMKNQSFIVDENGILGRKMKSDLSYDIFDDEQIRIINNVLLFTNDNWNTAKAAIGKVTYTNANEATVTNYGVIADSIIGTFILGSNLDIRDNVSPSASSVSINSNGITIKNGSSIVFNAKTNGDLELTGKVTATSGKIGGCAIQNGTLKITNANIENISASKIVGGTISGELVDGSNLSIGSGSKIAGWLIDSNSIYKTDSSYGRGTFVSTGTANYYNIGNSGSKKDWCFGAGGQFGVTKGGVLYASDAHITGEITATSGTFAGTIRARSGSIGPNEANYVWTIDKCKVGSSNTYTTSMWCGENKLAADAGFGVHAACVYMGVNGLSYRADVSSSDAHKYTTVIKPGVLLVHGDPSATNDDDPDSRSYRGVCISSNMIQFLMNGKYPFENTSPHFTPFKISMDPMHNVTINATGNITSNKAISTSSSRLRKKNIRSYSSKHEILFDNLVPRIFEYIDGESDGTHYGMVLDELGKAIERSGLTENECAAYCLFDKNNKSGDGGIAYSEFISMNTWQIQKLKKRVAELEAKVEQLIGTE